MTKSLLWSIVLAGFTMTANAVEPAYRFSKPIELPKLTEEELLAAPLDSNIYAATRDGFPDLRIRSGKQDVSYLLRKVTTTTSETTRDYWTAATPSIKPLADDGLEIILHLDKDDPQPQGIRIVSPLENFEQRLRVSSSSDGKNWQPVGEETVIFDYSQFMDVRSDTISFPAGSDRYYRIVIDKVTQQLQSQLLELTRRLRGTQETHRDERVLIERRPFRIDRIEFWHDIAHNQRTGDRKVGYPTTHFFSEKSPNAQQSVFEVDSRREPLTSLKLITDSHNFSRRAQVEVEETQGTEKKWRMIGSANLSRLDFRNLKREDLTISFPETRTTKYRIVIDNRGSSPLAVTGVEAEGNDYQVVFMATVTPQPCELVYGSETAQSPDYDVAAINASLDASYQPVAVKLGQQIAAPDVNEPVPFSLSHIINDPRILGGIALLLIAALAWGLYRAGGRLDGLSQDDR